MKLALLQGAVVGGISTIAAGAPVQMVLDTEFSGAQDPFGTIDLLFEQNGANSVKLTVTNNLATAGGTQFMSVLFLNLDPSNVADPDGQVTVNANNVGNGITTNSSLKDNNPESDNTFKADGDGYFDARLDWANGVFDESVNSAVFFLNAQGIIPEWFAFQSEPGGGNGSWYAAAHVQGVPADPNDPNDVGNGSGWVGGELVVIPLPTGTSLALLGLGAIGLYRRR